MIRRALPPLLGAAALLVAGLGCRSSAAAFGGTPSEARANGEAFFGAVADRFTRVRRTPRFEAARLRLARHAVTPSKIWGDTGVWTSSDSDGWRNLVLAAGMRGQHYHFHERPDAAPPRRGGDSRHTIRLRRADDDEYEWITQVEHAVGASRASEIAAVFTALLDAPAGRSERELRADYRATFPRARAALGRLLTLDTLRTRALADGSSMVGLTVSMHPARLRATMPAFAAYCEKYLVPARYGLALVDAEGDRWLHAAAERGVLNLRVRTRNGQLLPLDGPARPMPERLQLHMDLFAKVRIFTVGATGLAADFSFVRTARERGWSMRWEREPEWHLPLAVRHFIRAPLRRPFERGGTTLRITVRDEDAGPTLLVRQLRTTVRESAILRWMGALGFTAMSDFTGASEVEENRFLAEAFDALRLDVRAALAASPATSIPPADR